jgi:3-hydroxyacyl-CoA dehydrogenase/enoyl-CoA hydratase/3-hydroxybutyryl-CoA epimerase
MVTSYFERLKATLRRLEQLPFPVVAAINGTALGGGYELCLACHYRVALQSDKTVLGLPEVQFGILPAAGGVVRLTRLLGIEAALPFLLTGQRVGVPSALASGLIDEVAPTGTALLAAARAWIFTHPHPRQVWDRSPTPAAAAQRPVAIPAGVDPRDEAVMEITAIASLSETADVDAALREETHGMVRLVLGANAKHRIGEFFKMQAASRPQPAEASTA